MGFRVSVFALRVSDLGIWVQGVKFLRPGVGFPGFGFRVQGFVRHIPNLEKELRVGGFRM